MTGIARLDNSLKLRIQCVDGSFIFLKGDARVVRFTLPGIHHALVFLIIDSAIGLCNGEVLELD